MADIISDDEYLGGAGFGSESNHVAALGRISGKLLSANLLRNGVPLTFRNGSTDPDVLYIDVTTDRIGINTDSPVYDLDISTYTSTPITSIVATGTWSSALAGKMQILKSRLSPAFGSTVKFGWTMYLPASAATYVITYVNTYSANPLMWEVSFTSTFNGDSGVPEFTTSGSSFAGATLKTKKLNVPVQANIDNITFNANGTIGSLVGPIVIASNDINSIFHFTEMRSDYLSFNARGISSIDNRNIKLDPDGTGRVIWDSNTKITGNLQVNGNINIDGNLSSAGTVTVGDNILDTVSFTPDFTQDILPGTDITYDLGTNTKRWSELHLGTWHNIENWHPASTTVSDQILINGTVNKISGIQSNEDILLNPDTGITYIERTKWQNSELTNLNNTALTFSSTGIGYTRFMGTNAMQVPAGNNSQRTATPEIGETRWNTELGYMECWTGTTWTISTGGGETVTQTIMNDLADIYSIILG